jgi:anaerobic selenocysteine-containing dehydrogenase
MLGGMDIPIKPKTDVAFLFAMIHVLLHEHPRERLDLPFLAVRNVAGRRRWSKLREWLTVITCGHNFCRETAGQASSIGSGCGA